MLELTVDAVRGRDRILEVAAGPGLVTSAIAPVAGTVIATDYAAAMVEQLRRSTSSFANVTCEQADLFDLRFADGSFDAVVAANVLHLLPDLDGALASLRRVLRPGGVLVVPTYLHGETFLARMVSRAFALTGFPGRRRFSGTTLRQCLETAGFRVEGFEVIDGPFPVGFVAAA